jgi:hypothetical protein
MPKNFGEFTQEGDPNKDQFVVGYNTPIADGERRFSIGDISGAILSEAKPGGGEPQVQFNSGETFKGASALTYDYDSNRVAVGGTFPPDHLLHVSGAGPSDIESGVIKSNFGVQVGTGEWSDDQYLFMASGTGVFINYYTLPTSDPTNRGQIYRVGSALHVSAG